MRIINLKAENIKRLVAIDITPDQKVVKITGKNGQGKTSVLDCIWWGLAGASNIQARPIRTGEDEAYIEIDLGDIKVMRKFKYNKKGEVTTSLKITGDAGSPQAVIDKLVGDLTFDPLKFIRMDKKAQFETLRGFVKGVDFDKIDADNKADYEKRRDINRQYAEKKAAAEQISVDIKNAPTERIDISALMYDMENASKHNSEISSLQAERNADLKKIEELKQELASLQERIKVKINEPIDISALSKQISEAQDHNDFVKSRQEKVKLIDEAARLNQESERLTRQIEKRNKEKENAIADADLPVKGFSFGDMEILLNGQPFDQGSDAEQLKASLGIAMALNPTLKIIRVRDGSLLDEDSMKEVEKMAEENDFQIWIETVDGSGEVGFVIEEGKIKQKEQAQMEEWE